DNEYTAR
nr:Chain C, Lck Active Site Peptide [synthetic construct]3BRH_D Chain D, Lck Active Site Peptide [synthetic construct]